MRGEKVKKECFCGVEFEDYVSNKRGSFCSLPCYWEGKKGTTGYWLGKERSFEDRRKMSENRKGIAAGENHPRWKGGISSENARIRNSFEYKEWRKSVFRRDGWKCVLCAYRSVGKVNGHSDIEADHILSFSGNPLLRFEITNGRTLCRECHKKETFSWLWTQ